MTAATPDPGPTAAPGGSAPPPRPSPLGSLALVLTGTAAALLVGGVLFALASADAQGASSDLYRLLGQAANPFIALLTLTGILAVVTARDHRFFAQAASGLALGLGVAVSTVVALLAVNGILTDLTGDAGGLFRISAVVSRLGTIVLSAFGLWLASTAKPPAKR